MEIFTKIDNLCEITDEYILYNHNYIKNNIDKALNIVKEYIINNKLLIVGGTAIDYALKKNNDTLYNDLYQIPDFDIMSPNNIKHANNIGEILCQNKFDNVSIVPAIHHTTIRVQLLGFTVFDSTYIPEYLYNKLPYIIYNEFKIIHPNFQKINQYLSLSFLFKITGPSYNILNRFKKDINRFELLNKYYTLDDNLLTNIDYISFEFNIDLIQIDKIILYNKYKIENLLSDSTYNNNKIYHLINSNDSSYNIISNFTLHGVLAYNLIYEEFNIIYNKLISIIKINSDDLKKIKELYNNITIKEKYIINNNSIKFKIPKNFNLTIINSSNEIDKIINLFKKEYNISEVVKLDNILDIKPKYLEAKLDNNNFQIYDLFGDLLSINLIYIKSLSKFIPITSYNYNLMYFLSNYYLEETDYKKNINLSYYISLKSIIEIIQLLYYNYKTEFEKSEYFTNSIFNYSINTMGEFNYPDHYAYYIKNFEFLIKNNKNLDILPTKNYLNFPDCNIKNNFDFDKSPYYNKIQKKILDTNYFNEVDNTIDTSG